MSVRQTLTPQEVREYVGDYAPNNYLIDGEEFTDTYINMCMMLAADAFNMIPPISSAGIQIFQSKSLLLFGTLWQMYLGKALLMARNTMNYSDGGLQIPIEERAQLYQGLAAQFEAQFKSAASELKKFNNMESGWGEVRSDEAIFPVW